MRYSIHKIYLAFSLVVTVLFNAACGGGGSNLAGGGIGGTGITAFGTITGFGSVFVNGIEFETSGSLFDVDDDDTAIEGDLGIGMVVTVTGILNDDGVTGTADSIEYDDEIEGPITSTVDEDPGLETKTFTVFDTTVVVSRSSTVFANAGYATLAQDDVVEISGFVDEAGTLVATRLEGKGMLVFDVTEVEIKGTVSGCTGNCAGVFNIGSIAVSYDPAGVATDLTEMMPSGVVSDGQFVEVKGVLTGATTISASRIELEDEGIGDTGDNKVSIEGLVTEFSGVSSFKVAGQLVDATGAVFTPASLETSLADGMEIEVEGPIVGGVLQAVKAEARGGEIRIDARVQSTMVAADGINGSITLVLDPGNLTVTVDNQTALRDDTGVEALLALGEISTGDFLEVEAFRDEASGNLIATEIRRDAPDDDILQGPVDSCVGSQVTILGLSYTLIDGLTTYEDQNENPLPNGNDFCTAQVAGGFFVKVRDNRVADGVADQAELQD
jgi:hypothetical protein